jgi:hypothetical protein
MQGESEDLKLESNQPSQTRSSKAVLMLAAACFFSIACTWRVLTSTAYRESLTHLEATRISLDELRRDILTPGSTIPESWLLQVREHGGVPSAYRRNPQIAKVRTMVQRNRGAAAGILGVVQLMHGGDLATSRANLDLAESLGRDLKHPEPIFAMVGAFQVFLRQIDGISSPKGRKRALETFSQSWLGK